jgi:hypothetical protein
MFTKQRPATRQGNLHLGDSMKKFTTTTGKRQPQVKAKVVSLRDKKGLAWRAIADELGVAPRTVRRLYDEAKGAGAHFASRLEGKGGRTQAQPQAEEVAA